MTRTIKHHNRLEASDHTLKLLNRRPNSHQDRQTDFKEAELKLRDKRLRHLQGKWLVGWKQVGLASAWRWVIGEDEEQTGRKGTCEQVFPKWIGRGQWRKWETEVRGVTRQAKMGKRSGIQITNVTGHREITIRWCSIKSSRKSAAVGGEVGLSVMFI